MVFVAGGKLKGLKASSNGPRQESLQAHGGLNGCNRGIRASPTCGIASGRSGPRGVTIGSNELGKLSGLLLGAIPGKFSVGAVTLRNKRLVVNSRGSLEFVWFKVYSIQIGEKYCDSYAGARNWATVERSLFFKPIDIG